MLHGESKWIISVDNNEQSKWNGTAPLSVSSPQKKAQLCIRRRFADLDGSSTRRL